LALALCLGAALMFRLADLGARNLWTDEAWLALAALKAGPAEALAAGQSTPPWYLLTVWALAQVFGSGEAVLRSLSLILGMGAVLLMWPLARRLAPGGAAWLGLAAVAGSPVLVYFSKELKQYSGDAFFAMLLALLAERCRERPTRSRLALLTAAGSVGLGFSHPLVFILPVVLAVLSFSLPRPWRGGLALTGLLWGAAFLGYYHFFFSRQVDPGLLTYWAQDFPDFTGVAAFCTWLGGALARYFHYFFGDGGLWWAPPLLLAGLVSLHLQGRPRLLLYWAGPLLVAFVAAALHRYPFMGHYNGSRLMLFSAPFLYLGVAAGAATGLTWLWGRQRLLAGAAAAALVLSLNPVAVVRENLHPSMNRRQIKPLVDRLAREAGPRDYVYVYYYATYPVKYYLPDCQGRVGWGKSCVERGLIIDDDEDDEDEDQFPARVWLIAAHFPDVAHMEQFADELLGPSWQRTRQFTEPGAVLMCLERRAKTWAQNHPRPRPPVSSAPVPPSEKASE
jgi:hypothetical protein